VCSIIVPEALVSSRALFLKMVRDGYFYGLGFIAAAVLVFLLTGTWLWSVIPLLLALFFLWFFRDPARSIPSDPGLIVSPADGKIAEVARIRTPEGESIRLSIFLSVFDVHVNRSPIAGMVGEVRYQKGLNLNALNPESALKNEQNSVTVEGMDFSVIFSQVAGVLARRIVFRPKVGDFVERGQRVGLIKFGSRVNLLLPAHAELRVVLGERVKGGSSILAYISPTNDEPSPDYLAEALV
jgi:phosphatidylserine decarboxylase